MSAPGARAAMAGTSTTASRMATRMQRPIGRGPCASLYKAYDRSIDMIEDYRRGTHRLRFPPVGKAQARLKAIACRGAARQP